MGTLPDGIVTFLFTDVEGSTAMWEASPDSMMQALNQHDAVIEQAAEGNGGISVKPRGEGDSRFVVFPIATDAVAAVVAMQRGMAAIHWSTPRPLLVRMALHTGQC
ncbi:MAG: adenylate/guanylate cyclase domain-containing protein [Acidimicrobiia bacterium]